MTHRARVRRQQGRISRNPHDDEPDTGPAFRRMASMGAGPDRDAVRDEIVRAWLPMAERLAGRFRNRGESAEDLRQVAALGLVKAVNRYDPGRGVAFPSYAVPTVVGEVKRHFRDHLWAVHVPRGVQELRNRVREARRELTEDLDSRPPTVRAVAERAMLTEDEVLVGLEALDSYRTMSLEAAATATPEGLPLGDTLGEADPAIDIVVDRESLKPRLRALPDREKQILYLRFFQDMTQRQIGEKLGISQMHVSRLISHTCARLRTQLLAEA